MSEDVDSPGRLRKAPTAFRTISEVAEDLQIPQHVLRFWETKFPQLKPLKRGGGRRYYRPEDIALLRRIGDLLYTQGYTIKGVQRLLRDGGEAESQAEPAAYAEEAEAMLPEAGQSALRQALAELEALADALRALAQPAHPQE
ncbi:MerR family transcriptional regulator [Pseudoroseomonas cervicalis]